MACVSSSHLRYGILFLYVEADDCNFLNTFQATPKLSEDKVRQCVDARLGADYPPKAVAKVNCGGILFYALCVCTGMFIFLLFLLENGIGKTPVGRCDVCRWP